MTRLWRAKVETQVKHPVGEVTTRWFASIDGEMFLEVREPPELSDLDELTAYINGTGNHDIVPSLVGRGFFETEFVPQKLVHSVEIEELG